MGNRRLWIGLVVLLSISLAASALSRQWRINRQRQVKADTRALIGAVALGNVEAATIFIARGADVHVQNEGETLLFDAAERSNADVRMVRLLIAHGTDVNVQRAGDGDTVLMRVADGDNAQTRPQQTAEIVRTLLAAHPNLELKNMSGDTALRIAEKSGYTEIVNLLLAAGAKHYSIFPPLLHQAAAYQITDLCPGQANAVNNYGDVVGMVSGGKISLDGHPLGQAFLWSRGRLQILRTFGGPSSTAEAINDRKQVVGAADTWQSKKRSFESDYVPHAFLWQNGVTHDLHPSRRWVSPTTLFPDNSMSDAVAVNKNGLVALSVNGHLFFWNNHLWKQITDGPDSEEPMAMNNHGHVVLYFRSSGSESVGVWKNRGVQYLAPPETVLTIDDKTYTDSNCEAQGINDHDAVVGQNDDQEPLLWVNGKVSLLPHLYQHEGYLFNMRPNHINNRGQIVGVVSDELYAEKPERHAVLWQGGKVVDLNTLIPAISGWMLEEALGINELGQIVGQGTYHGQEHAFLLTPLNSPKRVY